MSAGFDPIAFLELFQGNNPPSVNVLNGDPSVSRTADSQTGPWWGDITNATAGANDIVGNPATTNDLFVGSTANEDFHGLGSEAVNGMEGANIFFGGGGQNTYYVGPGISQAEITASSVNPSSNWNSLTSPVPGSNDIVVLDDSSDGLAFEDIILQGVRDPQWLQDQNTIYYDPNYTDADDKISSHGRVGDRDYRIDYANGYSTYIVNFFDESGNPRATIHYDDCDPLVINVEVTVTQPPATTSPPATTYPPATTSPPVTQPPVTQPPVTYPPVTQPPVTYPPADDCPKMCCGTVNNNYSTNNISNVNSNAAFAFSGGHTHAAWSGSPFGPGFPWGAPAHMSGDSYGMGMGMFYSDPQHYTYNSNGDTYDYNAPDNSYGSDGYNAPDNYHSNNDYTYSQGLGAGGSAY